MKNFIRALKFCWPYRYRLLLSLFCALLAAAFWSLNFTAIYPVLTIVSSGKNLQQWVDGKIDETEKQIESHQGHIDAWSRHHQELEKGAEENPDLENGVRHANHQLARTESKLEAARYELYRLQIAKKYIYQFFPESPSQTLGLVTLLVLLSVALGGLFEFGQETLVGNIVGRAVYNLRNRFYRNAIHLDVKQFGESGTHEMMARFTNDSEILAAGMSTLFGKVIAQPLRAAACIAVACWISWQLTLMFTVLIPLAVLILVRAGRMMKKASRRLLDRMSNIYKLLQESFQGIRLVKAFTMESYERRRFAEATKDYYRRQMWVITLEAMTGPIIELLGIAAIGGALLLGAILVVNQATHLPGGIRMLNQPMGAPALIQLYALLAAIADPMRKLSKVYAKLQSGAAAADRIFKYYDLKPTITNNSDGPRLRRHHDGIVFKDICFSYEPNRPTLTMINLEVRHGETIALVGRNGSGKSTLVGLLPRFYDPDHGAILVDGVDIRNANLRSLRRQISIVTQKTMLFDDTFHNNIAYGNRRATREEVEQAARQARIHEFILSQPEGYDTRVGEAARVSGGQEQRIALARAFLRDPSILILDEFTSHADSVAESEINKILRDFMVGRTTFVITHRLNTLEIADRIVVLEGGRIEAVGTHPELLANCRVYQSLHEAHFQRMVA